MNKICLIIAIVCWGLAAFIGFTTIGAKANLVAAGLFFYGLGMLLGK